jgi:hypothetical protein
MAEFACESASDLVGPSGLITLYPDDFDGRFGIEVTSRVALAYAAQNRFL